ncbi:hypothetical protein [Bradyrhizobium paxllaeri]|uniref:hypothetical protein n=1 Tax=Bradyrhizobium paxllaeri TaxID=190148 RepID=UPI0011471BCF|nr:hypothetical protein [Bradyrhizobium paxllaeri]
MTQRIYTVRARNCEYRAAKPTLEEALIVAHEKVWQIAPGAKVSIYRGTELIGEIRPMSDVREGARRAA